MGGVPEEHGYGPKLIGRFSLPHSVHVRERSERPYSLSADMKARQSSKIRELAEAVESAGFLTLDEQARAWELPEALLGPYVGLAIKLPALRRR